MIDTLDLKELNLLCQKNGFSKIKMKSKICINIFCYENTLTYPVCTSNQKFENSMDLLLTLNRYVYIKDFDRFIFSKTKNKNEKYFCKSCLQCFSSKNVLAEYKKKIKMNGEQAVKLEKGTTEFKNYWKQIPVPFEVYADLECILKGVENNVGSCTKNCQDHIPYSFSYKLACVDNKFSKPVVLYKGENGGYEIY